MYIMDLALLSLGSFVVSQESESLSTRLPIMSDIRDKFDKWTIRTLRLSLIAVGVKIPEEGIWYMPIEAIKSKVKEAFEHSYGCAGSDNIKKLMGIF